MPETPSSRVRGPKVNATRNKIKVSHPDTREEAQDVGERVEVKDGTRNLQDSRQIHESRDSSDAEDDQKDSEPTDPEDKLAACLLTSLTDCSRQRLRALHMTLRHYGNVDNRVSFKDFQTSLQSNQIKLTTRSLQMIPEIYEDAQGLDYERLYRCMSRAHLRTGRDSIKARNKRNDMKHKQTMTAEEVDCDFLRRLEEQIVRDQTYFDVDVLRSEFAKWDNQGVGKINKEGAYLICSEKTPLYGALLKNLINRCDEDKNNKLSWPLLITFLETAQGAAWTKHPELSSLPERGREMATLRIATPEPIDELSSSTKVKVVNKLLKKNSTSDSPADAAHTGEYKLMAVHRQMVGVAFDREDRETSSQGEEQEPVTSDGDLLTETGRAQHDGSSNGMREDCEQSQNLANQLHVTKTSQQIDDRSAITGRGVIDGRSNDQDGHISGIGGKGDGNGKVKDGPHNSQNEEHSLPQVDVTQVFPLADVTTVPRDQGSTDQTKHCQLQLEWMYGYCGTGSNNNLGLLASGEMVYVIASTVVVYSRRQHQQRQYMEHTAAVNSLAVHSEGVIVASCQRAIQGDPGYPTQVRVWRSDSLQTMHVLGESGAIVGSVSSLSFMPATNVLACVDDGPERNLTIWETGAGALVARVPVPADLMTALDFSPCTAGSLVTCGREHLAWWTVNVETAQLQISSQPDYDNFLKDHDYSCLCHSQNGDVITGDTSGTIRVWGHMGADIISVVKYGHQGPVLDIVPYDSHFLTAGHDGAINCWAMGKVVAKESSLQLPASEGGVRSLLLLPAKGKRGPVLVVGTTLNSLIPVALSQTGSPLADVVLKDVPITQGHTEDLRAVTQVGKSFLGADVISASVDGAICKLNSETRKAVWKLWMKGYPFLCVDTNMEGDQIFLGTKDGKLVILAIQKHDLTVMEVLNKKISPGAVTCVRLSPDGKMLAASAHKHVHIYSLQGKVSQEGVQVWAYVGKCKNKSSPVARIDWSTSRFQDSHVMRASSVTQEDTFWDVTSCVELSAPEMAGIEWAFNIDDLVSTFQGMQSKLVSPDHVTCVDVSPCGRLVAMATSQGVLSLRKCTSNQEAAWSPTHPTHQRTYNLCFTTSGRSLLTVGGPQLSIMQWKITEIQDPRM